MSYPDEWEADVEAMLDDLAAADAIPESVKRMNDAAITEIAGGALLPGAFTRMVLDPKMPPGVAVLGDGEHPPVIITNLGES